MRFLLFQERSYGTNVPCFNQGPSDTVPDSGTELCNFLFYFFVDPLHSIVEEGQELVLVRKCALLGEAVYSIDCDLKIL